MRQGCCTKGLELRKSALQGRKAYGLGAQWTVPRIGYELKGQELRKSALQGRKAYGQGSQRTVPSIGYEIKDGNSG